jgi:hypothetical protein
MEPANIEQLRLLIALHTQLGIPYSEADLAKLSKWDASERISVLRGRPATSSEQLDTALLAVLRHRVLTDDEPTPAVPQPEEDNQPTRSRGR